MSNKISYTTIQPTSFVPSTSRFADSTVIYYGNQNRLTFNTYRKNTYPEGPDDKYAIVTAAMEYRPDLMSQLAYGFVDWWWKIMEANDIKDVYDFKTGLNIRIPKNTF